MDFPDLVSSIVDKMRKAGGVEVAFGNPHTVNDLTIIPVAKVSYGFGAGGGKSVKVNLSTNPTPDIEPVKEEHVMGEPSEQVTATQGSDPVTETQTSKSPENDFGGGGGGGMKTKPLGVFVIHKDHVKFMPVITVKEVSIALGLIMLTLWRIFRKKR